MRVTPKRPTRGALILFVDLTLQAWTELYEFQNDAKRDGVFIRAGSVAGSRVALRDFALNINYGSLTQEILAVTEKQ